MPRKSNDAAALAFHTGYITDTKGEVMGQTFKCKEIQCTQQVDYTPQKVPGSIGGSSFHLQKQALSVYLTCPAGHVHRYIIDPSDPSLASNAGTTP